MIWYIVEFANFKRVNAPSNQTKRTETCGSTFTNFVRMLGDKLQLVVKVVSHQDIRADMDDADQWIFRGNTAVDHLTSCVEFEHPQVRKVWIQLQQDLRNVSLFREAVHSTIVQSGQNMQYDRHEQSIHKKHRNDQPDSPKQTLNAFQF